MKKKERHEANRAGDAAPAAREGDHLQYLLTAYLFESISEAGKREVESHLETCARCRAELDELRETLGAVEGALGPASGGESYSFEARRLERVLAASRERGFFSRVRGFRRVGLIAAAAAALLAAAVIWPTYRRMDAPGRPAETATYLARSGGAKAGAGGGATLIERLDFVGKSADAPAPSASVAATKPADVEAFVTGWAVETRPALTAPAAAARATVATEQPAPAAELPAVASAAVPPAGPAAGEPPSFAVGATSEVADNPSSDDKDLHIPPVVRASKGGPQRASKFQVGLYYKSPEDDKPDEAKPNDPSQSNARGFGKAGKEIADRSAQPSGPAKPAPARRAAEVRDLGRESKPTAPPPPAATVDVLKADDQVQGLVVANEGERAPMKAPAESAEETARPESEKAGAATETRSFALRFRRDKDGGVRHSESSKTTDETLALPVEGVQQRVEEKEGQSRAMLEKLGEDLNADGAVDLFAANSIVNGPPEARQKAKQTLEALNKGTEAAQQAPQFAVGATEAVAAEPVSDDKNVRQTEHFGSIAAGRAQGHAVTIYDVSELTKTKPDSMLTVREGEIARANTHIETEKLAELVEKETGAKVAIQNGQLAVNGPPEAQKKVQHLLEQIRKTTGIMVTVESRFLDDSLQENFLAEIQADPGKAESLARTYDWYFALDPKLTAEQVQANRLAIPPPAVGDEGLGQEGFRHRYGVNPFVDSTRDRFSTFSMDVDTASYTLARNLLRAGRLPDAKQVRVEEFVNYFREDVAADSESAFSVACEGGPSPFGQGLDLLKVTVKARELRPNEEKPAVLTFAIDASGSMHLEHRLALVRGSLQTLVRSLKPEDRVGIVAYDAHAYLVLPHTPAREGERILGAIESLASGGGTNVEAGLELAYRLADEAFDARAVNRVILCSDGVANVGARGPDEILKKVQVFAGRGIYLSSVGFGMGRYNDTMLETLANKGNGNYAYVDDMSAAEQIFRQNLPSTLQVLAKDAKIQVDWSPEVVSSYRLLGYENRDVADKDFRNDKIDAGEVGPGTTVTVLYEIRRAAGASGDLGRIYLRYMDAGTGRVDETSYPLAPGVLATSLDRSSDRFRFIACVAETAELLRGSYWARDGSFGKVLETLSRLGPEFRARPECQEVEELAVRAQALVLQAIAGK